jgi:hypothetical protein
MPDAPWTAGIQRADYHATTTSHDADELADNGVGSVDEFAERHRCRQIECAIFEWKTHAVSADERNAEVASRNRKHPIIKIQPDGRCALPEENFAEPACPAAGIEDRPALHGAKGIEQHPCLQAKGVPAPRTIEPRIVGQGGFKPPARRRRCLSSELHYAARDDAAWTAPFDVRLLFVRLAPPACVNTLAMQLNSPLTPTP